MLFSGNSLRAQSSDLFSIPACDTDNRDMAHWDCKTVRHDALFSHWLRYQRGPLTVEDVLT